jgi:2,3,4,5-tetrahydropyridine-2-carboxylate N-succinyltransferase
MSNFEKAFGVINKAYEDSLYLKSEISLVVNAVDQVLRGLNSGNLRVAQKKDSQWTTCLEAKKAILLYFKITPMEMYETAPYTYHDKIPLKRADDLHEVRVVPGAVVRYSSFIEKGAILMPSFVNVGAFVGAGTMVDTWATVGSCAQVGRNCHLSGGVGIGGVLEPPQASPVIVEDHVFIGSRAIVVEGVHVEEGAVLGANVVLTASTKIIDVTGAQPVEYRGRVPARSVVIPGNLQKTFPAGTYGVPCALIIGQRKKTTDEKTSLNETLREFNISV